jgi:ABC-type antimicrobial peptide transport system permease subunit
VGSARFTLWLLLGASGLVLLIACANVANLLLARAGSRVREMAVRAALGTNRARIVRQLLVESGILALGGGALGLLLARSTLDALVASLPDVLHRTGPIELAGDVLTFALGVSLLCVVLFGVAPAWHASRADLGAGLADTGRSQVEAGSRGCGTRSWSVRWVSRSCWP